MKRRKLLGVFTMAAAITLSGCAAGDGDEAAPNTNQANNAEEESHDGGHGDHSGMDMSGSGEVPEGLKEKENPTFEVGSTATITDAHMPGMKVQKLPSWEHMRQPSTLFLMTRQMAENEWKIISGSSMKK